MTDVALVAEQLLDPTRRVMPAHFPRTDDDVSLPGMYAWFVDRDGADELSAALGGEVAPGLIYVGQAGAGLSAATLSSRIYDKHLHGNVRVSTFRFTLASALNDPLALRWIGARQMDAPSEAALTDWMTQHLTVAVVAIPDRLAFVDFEDKSRSVSIPS